MTSIKETLLEIPGGLKIVYYKEELSLKEAASAAGEFQYAAIVGPQTRTDLRISELLCLRPALTIDLSDRSPFEWETAAEAALLFHYFDAGEGAEAATLRFLVPAPSLPDAFLSARSSVSRLIDVLVRRHRRPLALLRLDLTQGGERYASEVRVPFRGIASAASDALPAEITAGIDRMFREAYCSHSSVYRLLCAHRICVYLMEIRAILERWGTDSAELPAIPTVEFDLTQALGIPSVGLGEDLFAYCSMVRPTRDDLLALLAGNAPVGGSVSTPGIRAITDTHETNCSALSALLLNLAADHYGVLIDFTDRLRSSDS